MSPPIVNIRRFAGRKHGMYISCAQKLEKLGQPGMRSSPRHPCFLSVVVAKHAVPDQCGLDLASVLSRVAMANSSIPDLHTGHRHPTQGMERHDKPGANSVHQRHQVRPEPPLTTAARPSARRRVSL